MYISNHIDHRKAVKSRFKRSVRRVRNRVRNGKNIFLHETKDSLSFEGGSVFCPGFGVRVLASHEFTPKKKISQEKKILFPSIIRHFEHFWKKKLKNRDLWDGSNICICLSSIVISLRGNFFFFKRNQTVFSNCGRKI
jgi:hypothetical protein